MRLFLVVAAAVAVVIGGLWIFQRRLIYLPAQRLPEVDALPDPWRDAAFETIDGLMLHGWFAPPSNRAPIVIVFNGNAGNRAGRLMLGETLAVRGLGVLLVDYRGYGGNPGRPTENGLARDARAATEWVRSEAPGHPVAYLGESLGAAVAVGLAAAEPPDALVLRSPFTSLAAVGSVHYPFLPVRLILWDRFSSLERMRRVDVPVLVIAGTSDSIVPIEQSRAIYEAAPGVKRWLPIEGADHNDARLATGAEVVEAIVEFIEEPDR